MNGHLFFVFLSVTTAFAIGFMWGFDEGGKAIMKDGLKNGQIEYYLDENHDRQWRWVNEQKEK